jgi:hypothetical protein
MRCPLQPSWIEQTIDLCDEVLIRAAKAHPTNLLLGMIVRNIKMTEIPVAEAEPPSCIESLAS